MRERTDTTGRTTGDDCRLRHLAIALTGGLLAWLAVAPAAVEAQEATGSITILSVELGPTAPDDPQLRLVRDGGSDVWDEHCAPGPVGTIECADLPVGVYTIETGAAGMVLGRQCIWEGVNGTFYPVRIAPPGDDGSTLNWDCWLWLGEPGLLIHDLGPSTPDGTGATVGPVAVTFEAGEPDCVDLDLGDGDGESRWCTSPQLGRWTLTPPDVIPTDADFTPRCLPMGYYSPGTPLPDPDPVVTTTKADPMWECWVTYPVVFLRWSIVGEPDSADAELVDAPWTVVDLDTGTDVSGSCAPIEPDEGELVAYHCDVDPGVYSVTVEGLDDPYAFLHCEEVYVDAETTCVANQRNPTTALAWVTMWFATGETWPDSVTLSLTGGPGTDDPGAPTCIEDRSDVESPGDGVAVTQLTVTCTELLPGRYEFALGGAPGSATVTSYCTPFDLARGGNEACSFDVATVSIPGQDDDDEPWTDPISEEPAATLPGTGSSRTTSTTAAAAAALLAAGMALVALSRRRPTARLTRPPS